MSQFFRRRFLLCLTCLASVGLLSAWAQAGPRAVSSYFWRGSGDSFSSLPTPRYQQFLRSVFKDASPTIEDKPSKERVLAMFRQSTIVYCNAHGGHQTTGQVQQFLKVGDSLRPEHKLLASEFQALARERDVAVPRLVVMAACTTLADPMPGELRIPEALGFTAGTQKKAYIGFKTVIAGFKCDGFFRVFFGKWLARQPNGAYPTLEEARVATVTFLQDFTNKNGNRDDLFINTSHITVGADMSIFGDANLRYSDLLAPLPR